MNAQSTTAAVANRDLTLSEIVQLFTSGYDPMCKYLRRIEFDLPKAIGYFRIDCTFTTEERADIGHFSAFEQVICFNQLAFATFAKAFHDGFFPGIEAIPYEEFVGMRQSRCWILGMDNVRYVKAFAPNVEFPGVMTIKEHIYKPHKQLLISTVNFDCAEGKALADATIAVRTGISPSAEQAHAVPVHERKTVQVPAEVVTV
jgi:hypothetical protein